MTGENKINSINSINSVNGINSRNISWLLAFCFIIASPLAFLAQPVIFGDSMVSTNTFKNYIIKTIAVQVEWRLNPSGLGKITQGQGTNQVSVFWDGSVNDSSACTITALVKYPNASKSVSFSKAVKIKGHSKELGRQVKPRNLLFSKTSAEGLRFFWQLKCDSSLSKQVEISDSSLAVTPGTPCSWTISTEKGLAQTFGGPKIRVKLLPGKYIVVLEHEPGTVRLSDSLRVFAKPQPEFEISTQVPCRGSVVTFSNTSRSSDLALKSTFYFGDGSFYTLGTEEMTASHAFEGRGMQTVLLSFFEQNDLHGCPYKSKTIPVSLRDNRFNLVNVGLTPKDYLLKQPGDSVLISCTMGSAAIRPNPNGPFTYLWSNGQTSQHITAAQRGEYSVIVTDKYGCKSRTVGPSRVVQAYADKDRPQISGPAEIIAGQPMMFKIQPKKDCLYQWKFIYNGQEVLTTEPKKDLTIIPPGWEKAKPGKLQVVGIALKVNAGKYSSSYSDTLNVVIK